MMAQYRAVVGIDYPPNKRVEAGELVSDLPATSIKWLLESGSIELADGKQSKKEPAVETPVETPVVEVAKEELPEGFKPDAKDGDKDGFVQDGTPFERPVEEKP